MLSKNKIKFIQSLDRKKARRESGCFLAEGNKLVGDTLSRFDCELLVATGEWLRAHPGVQASEIIEATADEIARASLMSSPQDVLAVYHIPRYELAPATMNARLSLALDTVQDPGNMGTIVRIADWYGIEDVVCSPLTADLYNPKTVQATMGALARVKVHYMPLGEFFSQIDAPIYGTFLDGENIYSKELTANGVIVMGNEGQGISPEVERYVSHRLFLPNYPQGRATSESLNVAVATAVVCAEFRRPR